MPEDPSQFDANWVYDVPMALSDECSQTRGLEPEGAPSRIRRYVRDSGGCTVGPMPAQHFLDAFLPPVPVDRKRQLLSNSGAFETVPRSGAKPADVYEPLIAALNTASKDKCRAPGLVFENASLRSEQPHEPGYMKPHVCCYASENLRHVQDAPTSSRTELGYAEFFIEVKPDIALDFFVDPSPEATAEELRSHNLFARFHDEKLKARVDRALGQHIAYAMEIQARQQRVCLFSISMSGSSTRLLRWDRSGIIVTRSFDIRTHPELLCEFLGRFACASRAQRGFDETVEMAVAEEVSLFRDAITAHVRSQGLSDADLDKAVTEHYRPNHVMAVHVSVEDDSTDSHVASDRYLVSRPVASPLHLAGRPTRGYWAVHAATKRVVFLKDTWRTPGEREGAVIAKLNAVGVRNVPLFVAHGDVHRRAASSGSEQRSSSPIHRTETDLYDSEPWVCRINGERIRLSSHIHYRLILGTVGYGLKRFRGTHELLHAGYDVFQAMRGAYEKDSRLHRDISIGNIILVKEPDSDTRKGYLIDWETSSRVDEHGRSLDTARTGTWKFMSAKVLLRPEQPHVFEDDMESLVYVVLYCALLHLPHNLSPKPLESIMHQLFDSSVFFDGELRGGASKAMNRGTRALTRRIKFTNLDFQKWLDDVLNLHGPPGHLLSELEHRWQDPNNLDALWKDFLADHTLALQDRIDNVVYEPEPTSNKPETSLASFVAPPPPPPSVNLKRRSERDASIQEVGSARPFKRRRLVTPDRVSAPLHPSETFRAHENDLESGLVLRPQGTRHG
ncbi:hypothetical protein BV20DRAFT_956708 [Pilatotrama ljubarskyi]|nr:hypothetical protein BV20DRAFT_956708 [Pilatotrama ljubarskyi]